ncbi:transporter, NhaC family (TC 2.A.35) [Lachnospiraceae bacterium C7]|nr:transporter, NhaC family (TC 2.A.35) [Lachnospiraceae bacterium C7]
MNSKKVTAIGLVIVIAFLVVYTLANPVDMANLKGYSSFASKSILSLLPPVIAITLALVTKEVFSSLFVGIVCGATIYSNFNLELTIQTMLFNKDAGMVTRLSDPTHMGILVFLVVLGILVSLMNRAGGSAAFGKWASNHIKTRVGAQLATMCLGILIFIDDYFNCLTVGSVMRPVTDSHKVSRAKLSYIIDATAAPICIIAPISSWAAAVTSSVPQGSKINGFVTFLRTIPYNYYPILTIIMMIFVIVRRLDYGKMRLHEDNAINGDLYTTSDRPYDGQDKLIINHKGKVIDLLFPVIVLIIACIFSMVYTGGFFEGVDFITAFSNSDSSVGLVMGGFIALIITFIFYMYRDVISFEEFMSCVPEGFKSMVSPIIILTLAWTLSGTTNILGAKIYVASLIESSAGMLTSFLPAVIFVVAFGLSFATGTSWGTFSILIPIVVGVFPSGEMMIISIAACLSGAVCGDHCSPISDTTIMASAGGQCSHLNHVETQLPYVLTVGTISVLSYILAGIIRNTVINLVIAVGILLVALFVVEKKVGRERNE